MATSELAPLMHYDLRGVLPAIVVAVLLWLLASWLRLGLHRRLRLGATAAAVLAAGVMGPAVAGMQHADIAALCLAMPGERLAEAAAGLHAQAPLALAIAAGLAALGMLIFASIASFRYRHLLRYSQRSESRLQAVTDTAVDGIVTVDGHGVVQSFNPAAERMFGWTADEMVGRRISLLMTESRRAEVEGDWSRYLQENAADSGLGAMREVVAQRKDGTQLPMQLAIGKIDQLGECWYVFYMVDLSERRALERAREQGQEQLRSLVGNLPGVAFRCRNEGDWPMLFISDAVEALTGWSADDFLQDRIYFGQLIDPQDAKRIAVDVEFALAHGYPYHVEYRIRTRQGRTRWVSENGRGVADDEGHPRWIDGVILDISESKARNAEYVGTVQALNRAKAVAEFDLRGRLLDANENFLALMGYPIEEVLGQPHALFCGPGFVEDAAYLAFWEQLAQGQFQAGEFQRFGKGGREIWLHATYNPVLDAEGKVIRILKLVTDLSERRAMEQDLRLAKERAEQAAAARTSFVANMSHEIRTPMNAIIGFTEALLDSPLDASQRRHLETVRQASRSLLHLLNDVLDTAKLDKGAMVLESLDFSLRGLCRQTLDTLRIGASRKGLALLLDYPDAEPDYLRGDALRLQQVLLNLLGNAIKFTQHGQVELRVRYARDLLELAVSDTGIGMDAGQLERVFAPFAQADASTARRFGGTGLGTTIARQLVELMGGRIEVQSQPGQGSVFTLRLPLPLGQAPLVQEAAASVVLPPLRILAVDDVAANLELLQLALVRDGHRLAQAGSGEDALDCYGRERFDLLLLDLQMPGIDGIETARRIRALEQDRQAPRLPIIALSASVLDEDRKQALAAGMDGFAHKPLDLPRLRAEIARVLGLAAPAGALAAAAAAPIASGSVDWAKGSRMWGSEAAFRQALGRFLQQHTEAATQLRSLRQDAVGLAAMAHRLRGAAANLALLPLQALLAELEAAARAGDATTVARLLEAAVPAWEAVLAEAPMPDTAGGDAGAIALAAAEAAQALALLGRIEAALQRGELPAALLAELAGLLPAGLPRALDDALERFEFDYALALLGQLRTALQENLS